MWIRITKYYNLNSQKNLKSVLKFLLFLGIGASILYFVYLKQSEAYKQECILKGIDAINCNLIKKVYNDFISTNIFVLLSVIFIFFLSNVSRAIRWQMLLKPIGVNASFKIAFHSIMLGYFANLGLPRVGEFVRAGALAKKEKVKFDKVMGTIVLDRLLDVISLLLVFLITLIVSSRKIIDFIANNSNFSEKISGIINNPIIWFGLALFLIGLLFLLKSKGLKNSMFGKKVTNFIQGLLTGIKSIRSVEKPGWFIFHSIFIWLMYFIMNPLGFLAFEPTAKLGLDAALVVFTFGSLGIVIPSPGGMGTYHFLVIEALKLFGVSGSDGFSFANIIFFSVQIIGIIFFGVLALIALNRRSKKILV